MYRAIAHGGKLAPYKWNAATLTEVVAMLDSVGGSLWVADPQYLALNSDGSGAVTVGSAVGYMRDLCAAARHMTQATTAAKPLINQVGGKWAMQFDGVNDFLSTVSLPAVAAETIVIAKTQTTKPEQFRATIAKLSGNTGFAIYADVTSTSGVVTGTGTAQVYASGASINTGTATLTLRVASGDRVVRENGYQVGVRSDLYTSTNAAMALGASSGGSAFQLCDIYAAAYAPVALTDAQCLLVERYLASLSGVTIA